MVRTNVKVELDKDQAARRIQHTFKGWRVRLDHIQRKAQIAVQRREVLREADMQEAATVIQAQARGMIRRRATTRTVLARKAAASAGSRPVGIRGGVHQMALCDDELRDAFRRFDVDGNGFITKEEFAVMYRGLETFGVREAPDALQKRMVRYRTLGDDKLSYEEFAILMLKISKR